MNFFVSFFNSRFVSGIHYAHDALHCQTAMPACRLTNTIDSTDTAATLEDFGFKPDLTAATASLNGELEWRPASGQPWLTGLQGTLTMRLADGSLRAVTPRSADEGFGAEGEDARSQPFALLAVPALVNALDAPGAAGASLTKERPALHFDRLEADFALADGQATPSHLHIVFVVV